MKGLFVINQINPLNNKRGNVAMSARRSGYFTEVLRLRFTRSCTTLSYEEPLLRGQVRLKNANETVELHVRRELLIPGVSTYSQNDSSAAKRAVRMFARSFIKA